MTAALRAALACLTLALGACAGEQSALAPVGDEAARISLLFWVMTTFLGAVFAAVLAATLLARNGSPKLRALLSRERFVLAGGLVLPVIALTALFLYGLLIMASRAMPDEGAAHPVRIAVSGEQWWWRVTYVLPDGSTIASANELRIPVGVPVVLELTTADVLHSFWVPKLAGKLDMVPGRRNRLTLHASEPGASRGQCAEYCGGAHAFMSFHVVALEAAAYEAWLAAEREAAATVPVEHTAGAQLFATLGCAGCHAIRGTDAAGTIGPDLTHVGSRMSLAAASLSNDAASFARWLRDGQHIKPGNRMPPYEILSEEELAALANYLEALE
jgi:cytochrome c oxidase subunit 2